MDLLPRLAGEVVVPSAVARELSHVSTPDKVRAWLAHPPEWLRVTTAKTIDSSLGLDPGETEAISLALERGLKPIGLLAVLEFSAANGWIDFEEHIARLRNSTFRLNERLLVDIRERLRRSVP